MLNTNIYRSNSFFLRYFLSKFHQILSRGVVIPNLSNTALTRCPVLVDHYSRKSGPISDRLKARFYFAHPYASWERGLNENTNGLIRQYFPKRHDFTTITQDQIDWVMDKLNNRPRKCLGMKTPNQVFFGINPPVALVS